MKGFFFLLLLTSLVSCQDYNSNSADEGRFTETELPPAPDQNDPAYESYVKFVKSYNIIKTRCFQCHSGDFANLVTNESWINSGFVVKNITDNSTVITRLKNYNGPYSDMPTGSSSNIPTSEYLILLDWIETMP
jgi:uncharacterized membrane protein